MNNALAVLADRARAAADDIKRNLAWIHQDLARGLPERYVRHYSLVVRIQARVAWSCAMAMEVLEPAATMGRRFGPWVEQLAREQAELDATIQAHLNRYAVPDRAPCEPPPPPPGRARWNGFAWYN